MASYPIRNRHWTRKEYDELIKSGFFDEDEPIELLGGQLVVAEPKGSPHSTAVALTVPGRPRDSLVEHPASPALLVEVAESRLAFDRGHKGSLYARARIADYWIVNLVDAVLEVYRGPAPDRSAEFGWRYLDVQTLRPGAAIAPLARPDVTVAVADLLP
jgi:Uma2 family endonuclease